MAKGTLAVAKQPVQGKRIVKQISPKSVCGTVPTPKEGETIHLYDLAGIVTGFEQDESTYGEWTRFTGSFVAITPDGREIRSPKAFIQEPLEGQILFQLKESQANDKGVLTGINFACRLSIVYSAKSNTRYEYVIDTLMQQQLAENDPIKLLT